MCPSFARGLFPVLFLASLLFHFFFHFLDCGMLWHLDKMMENKKRDPKSLNQSCNSSQSAWKRVIILFDETATPLSNQATQLQYVCRCELASCFCFVHICKLNEIDAFSVKIPASSITVINPFNPLMRWGKSHKAFHRWQVLDGCVRIQNQHSPSGSTYIDRESEEGILNTRLRSESRLSIQSFNFCVQPFHACVI